MKNYITTLILLLAATCTSFANTVNPNNSESEIIFENIDMTYLADTDADISMIIDTKYSLMNEYFQINAKVKIDFLQVTDNDGNLMYQLPIGSKKLNLSISDFDKGQYKVNLLFEGSDKLLTTELIKKTN